MIMKEKFTEKELEGVNVEDRQCEGGDLRSL
jgi:hypothetical protein